MNKLSSRSLSSLAKSFLLFLQTIIPAEISKKEVFFVIGIDTEQDVDEKYIHSGRYLNIKEGIPRLLDIFNDFEAKPTWFVTPDVAQHCGRTFSKLAKTHEIGCHIHPEYFVSSINGTKMEKILPHFSYEAQLKMVQEASGIINQNIGVYPRSFRAGRFAVNRDTFRVLELSDFNVDCSMTPFVDWEFHDATLNSRRMGPFFLNAGSRCILEIPVTIVRPFNLFSAWLRPSFLPGSDMINIIKMRARSEEYPLVLNMMFHSMELIDPNPYFASEAFFRNIRSVLEYVNEQDFSFITMNDLYHHLKSLIF